MLIGTKTGKPRYFVARTPRVGTIGSVPAGFEVTESINAVVSVRRIQPPVDPTTAADVRVVEAELKRHAHLRYHRVQAEGEELLIYGPDTTSPERYLDVLLGPSPFPGVRSRAMADLMARSRYSPVMKFVRDGKSYAVMRMTYRGNGGWSYPLASGTIATLVKKFVRPIGTDAFFELY